MNLSRLLALKLARVSQRRALPRIFNLCLPWLVLAITIGGTLLLWKNALEQADRTLQAEFNYSVQETVNDIELRMENYKLLLRGLQGLFASSTYVSQDEFHTYVETLDIKTRYPGIQGLGYSLIVPAEDVPKHVAKIRKSGFPQYDIKPAGKRDLITSIVYIEPFTDRNQRAFGFDMYSDPVRRAAMDRARNLNQAALSGKIVLQQESETDTQPGFVMYLPIFGHQAANSDNFDRSPTLIGWVHAQFRANDLMSVLSIAQKARLDLAIYDGETPSEQARLSGSKFESAKSSRKTLLKITRPLTIAGRAWTLEARSLPALEARFERQKPRLILITGIGTSLLLTMLVYLLIHGREHALRIAHEINSALIMSEYRWKFALEGAGEGVWDWNLHTGTLFMSLRLKEMLGYAENELSDSYDSWQQHLHPEDRQQIMDALDAHIQGHTTGYAAEGRLHCKDGSWKWMLMRGMIVSRDATNKPLRMIGTLADISERHSKDESLQLSETVFNTVDEAVLVTDPDHHIIAVNPAFCRITGYASEDVVGQSPAMLASDTGNQALDDRMWHLLVAKGNWQGEVTNRRKNGKPYIASISINSVRNSKGQITNYVAVFSDISERKETERRMQHLAHYDPLTDLPNRELFTDRLRQALAAARRNKDHLALMFIDLDKFKPINDTLGHNIGDLLLKEVAYRLLDCIRASDTAARIGGDEFVVLLPGTESVQNALVVANKILQAIQDPCDLEGHDIRISASIGIALYPEHGQTDEEILTNADNAMYQAKHGGGSAIRAFSDDETKPA